MMLPSYRMKVATGLMLAFLFCCSIGCRTAGSSSSVSVPAQPAARTNETNRQASATNVLRGRWHTVEIAPKRKDISTWAKFNPVWWYGNIDDPEPPGWFRPDEQHRVGKWRARNPFHNFTFYVIGIADKPHYRSGRYPRNIGNPNGGWNFAVARRRLVVLPFVAYNRGKFDFYFGWRTAGNFGAKINFNAKRPPRTQRTEVQSPAATSPSDKTAAPASGP